jgi:hypothetical protein
VNNRFCVGSTCVTPAQFQAMVAAANQSNNSSPPPQSSSNATTTPDTPPVIHINGDNPAIIHVGDTYNDLGATITGPQADLNLGVHTFVNGVAMDSVQIDSTQVATDTISYVVTDQSGLTATSTRTVIVVQVATQRSPDAATGVATSSAADTASNSISTASDSRNLSL